MADYTIPDGTGSTYNSSNNTSASDTKVYFSNNRKNRFKITDNSWLTGKKIKRAFISFSLVNYYNKYWTVTHCCDTTGNVNTVFPSNDLAAIVADKVEQSACVTFYPVKEYRFDITEILKYAQTHYTGTWYLWQFFQGTNSDSHRFNYPSITIESQIGGTNNVTVYVYKNDTEKWVPASPFVYDNGEWNPGSPAYCKTTNNFVTGGTWATATYPTSSMGVDNSDFAAASSVYADNSTNFKPVCALGENTSTGWMSSNNATGPWIQIHLPHDAYNLEIDIYNSSGNSRRNNGPLSGTFYYSDRHNLEPNIQCLKSTGVTFTRPDGLTNSAKTTHYINNNYPIRNIAIECATWEKNSSHGFCCIGKLVFRYKYKA
jgi:hypothetical protein